MPALNQMGDIASDEPKSLGDDSPILPSLENSTSDLRNGEKSHDEEESGLSNSSTSASSVCNSINGHDHAEQSISYTAGVGAVDVPADVENGPKTIVDTNRTSSKEPEKVQEDAFISYNLPLLSAKDTQTQADLLLLAWALLVYRNGEGEDECACTWNVCNSENVEPSSHQNIFSGETGNSSISRVLSAIRAVRQEKSLQHNDNAELGDLYMFMGTVDASSSQTSKVIILCRLRKIW